jgi:ElaB/YqjD/DUF883 family membrane-anchored ribosome-binding protein
MSDKTEKRCPACSETKSVNEFNKNSRAHDGLQSVCRECHKLMRKPDHLKTWYKKNRERVLAQKAAYYQENTEEMRARSNESYQKNRERISKYNKEYGARLRIEALNAYGNGKCECCGEIELRFLTLDHIEGCGNQLRKIHGTGFRLYHWLKKHDYPEGFQVLCYNCNLGRHWNGGVCPHQS